MSSNKLTHVHVYLIGGVVMLIIAGGLFFALIRPLNIKNDQLRSDISRIESEQIDVDGKKFTYSQLKGAQVALKGARDRQARKAQELAMLETRKQLPAGQRIVIPASETEMLSQTLPPWLVLPQVVVQRIEAYSKQLAARHHVKVTTQFAAPAPTTNPAGIPKDIIAWNLGPMTVQGPYANVMAWARDWNNAPLLVSVDGLQCTVAGPKGQVTATSNLTVYIFPTGPGVQKPGPAQAAGAPGGFSGGAPGMEGMPGAGMGPSGMSGSSAGMSMGNGPR